MSFSSSWTLPSIFPNAPFIIRLMVFSRFPSLIKFAIRFALSSKEPVPFMRTFACSFGRELIKSTASCNNFVSTSPRELFKLCATVLTESILFIPASATLFIDSPRTIACSLVILRDSRRELRLIELPENVCNDWEAIVNPFDNFACSVTKFDTISAASLNFLPRYAMEAT